MTKDEVLAKLVFDVELRGLSKNTQNEYYSRVKGFQDHFNKPATELDIEDIRQFLHYLTKEKKLASGSVNTYNSALRFLYGITFDINLAIKKIPRHRKHRNARYMKIFLALILFYIGLKYVLPLFGIKI